MKTIMNDECFAFIKWSSIRRLGSSLWVFLGAAPLSQNDDAVSLASATTTFSWVAGDDGAQLAGGPAPIWGIRCQEVPEVSKQAGTDICPASLRITNWD